MKNFKTGDKVIFKNNMHSFSGIVEGFTVDGVIVYTDWNRMKLIAEPGELSLIEENHVDEDRIDDLLDIFTDWQDLTIDREEGTKKITNIFNQIREEQKKKAIAWLQELLNKTQRAHWEETNDYKREEAMVQEEFLQEIIDMAKKNVYFN